MNFLKNLFGCSSDITEITMPTIEELHPETCQGYRINYNDPYYEKCPEHGCTCYQTYENPSYAYCPKCGRILIHYDDRW